MNRIRFIFDISYNASFSVWKWWDDGFIVIHPFSICFFLKVWWNCTRAFCIIVVSYCELDNLFMCSSGVPKLNRSELVTACEDFSNIISTFDGCTVYKGTLSSGVEIAVASTTISSFKDWTKAAEMAYRKKVCGNISFFIYFFSQLVIVFNLLVFLFFNCCRLIHSQGWTTRILLILSATARRMNLLLEWWCLNMLQMDRCLSICTVIFSSLWVPYLCSSISEAYNAIQCASS